MAFQTIQALSRGFGPERGSTSPIAAAGQGVLKGLRFKREQDASRSRSALIDERAAEARQIIEQRGKMQSVRDYARDLLSFRSAPDVASARGMLVDRIAKLNEQSRTDPSINAQHSVELLRKLDEAPDDFARTLAIEIDGLERMEIIAPDATTGGRDSRVLSSAVSEILPGGGSIQIQNDGSQRVINGLGVELFGQDAADFVARADKLEAERKDIDAERKVGTARRIEQVKNAEKTSAAAFGMVDKIRQNITNLEKVTPLIGRGADTGPITSFFPSFRAATVELEQLQKRLALDVVGAVTFGALSKGELDLAKDVALPVNLQGDALIEWVNRKIGAQRKLATYFEDQAIFLSGGKTQADWLEKERQESAAWRAATKAQKGDLNRQEYNELLELRKAQ